MMATAERKKGMIVITGMIILYPQTMRESLFVAGTDFSLREYKGGIFHYSDATESMIHPIISSLY